MPVLDAIRGIAILLVLAHNFNVIETPNGPVELVFGLVADFGWVGVLLFFVLSGFLISGILLDTQRAQNYLKAFFSRRVLRIFPLYYSVLAFAFVLYPLVTGQRVDGEGNQIWLWTYLSNWAAPLGRPVHAFPHFWSLAVEEQFYLVWPIVVRRTTPRSLIVTSLVMALVAFGTRVCLRAMGAGPDGAYAFTVCRFDALAFGAVAAALVRVDGARAWIARHLRGIAWGSLALFFAGAVVTRGYPRVSVMTQTAGYTCLGICFTGALLLAVFAEAAGAKWVRLVNALPLQTVGKYSYAMYVFHHPMHALVGAPLLARYWPDGAPIARQIVYLSVGTLTTFGVAWVSYHVLEKHFLQMKRRFVATEG